MPVSISQIPITQIEADAVVVGIIAESVLTGAAHELDEASGGALARLIETKEVSTKRHDVTTILAPAGIRAPLAAVVGLGPKDSFDRGAAFRCAAAAAKHLAGKERGKVAYYLADGWSREQSESGIAGSLVGCLGQDIHRSKKNKHVPGEVLWAGVDDDVARSAQSIADGVNLARRLVNAPPNEEAVKVAESCGLGIDIWDKKRLVSERCGSLLGVAEGSAREPRLVILRYQGGKAGEQPIAFVGKGVTFDSGGLSIKPTDGMTTMKCDMAGGAAVLGAMQTIARLKLPVNIVGLCGLVENMLSGTSYKLGDVLKARSGKTIEVLNTDAEGRLVLADVLNVALDQNPSKLIDLATLTGACVVALGNDVAGMMTNDQSWCDAVKAAADACGEPMWQLPMFAEYGEQIRSEVADIKNVGNGRWGGAITAAKFLEEFVGGKPWVHLDIAGPAFLDSAKPWIDAGGSGFAVRTLVEVARRGS
jgi:leucyl aminopeptidase